MVRGGWRYRGGKGFDMLLSPPSPHLHVAPRTGRGSIDRSIILNLGKRFRSTIWHYMALVASSGPIKHTKVNSGDVRLRKSEVIVLDVLMKNEATYKHWHMLDIMKAFKPLHPTW